MKYFITFGTNHLENFAVSAGNIFVVIEADTENDAREPFFEEPFNGRFGTSYKYDDHAERFKRDYHMVEYTLEELFEKQFD